MNNELDLEEMARRISKNELVLPNFQRKYVWGNTPLQVGYLASILARIPLGNIIIFKDDKNKFACRRIGKKESLDPEEIKGKKVDFLLDGQQRLTTLLLMFSNNLYKKDGKINFEKLLTGLCNRFFIKLPRYDITEFKTSVDFFGFLSLKLPFDDIPNFCSNDIFDGESSEIIEVKSFAKDGNEWYNPKFEENYNVSSRVIDEACYNRLIPCYWLLDNSNALGRMLSDYAHKRAEHLYNAYSDVKGSISNGKKILCKTLELVPEKSISKLTDDEFKNILEQRAGEWAKQMEYYLRDCITRLKINSFEVGNDETERAIDIYEALNKGGVELSTYDLIIARAAKEDTQNSLNEKLERIVKEYKNQRLLNKLVPNLPDWNSKDQLKAIAGGSIDKSVVTQFLNLLCITQKCEVGKMRGTIKADYCREKEQLKLLPKEIINGSEDAMESIIDALMYLNIKQGVYKLSSIHYKFTLLPVAYAFYVAKKRDLLFGTNSNEENFFFNMLNAWYKTAVFTDFYQTNQSVKVIEHIQDVDDMLCNHKLPFYFSDEGFATRQDMVLNVPYYNDYKMLTFNEPGYNLSRAIETYITQYYLSLETGAYDILKDDKGREIPLKSYDGTKLAIHHFFPLYIEKELKIGVSKNTKDIRNDSVLINSPLNKIIISEEANKKIGSLIPIKYFEKIPSGYCIKNDFDKDGYFKSNVEGMVSNEFLNKIYEYRYSKMREQIKADIKRSVDVMKNLLNQ